MKLTRRHVLATAAAVPAAAALGGLALGARWWDRPPGAGLAALSADEHAFVDALAEAWMPAGGTPALSGAEARLADFFDDVLAHVDATNRALLKVLLQALDDLPFVTHGAAFRDLGLADRDAVLRGWLTTDQSLLRNGVTGVVALLALGWADHPDVAAWLSPMFPCGVGR
jgi:hypothetical protein